MPNTAKLIKALLKMYRASWVKATQFSMGSGASLQDKIFAAILKGGKPRRPGWQDMSKNILKAVQEGKIKF